MLFPRYHARDGGGSTTAATSKMEALVTTGLNYYISYSYIFCISMKEAHSEMRCYKYCNFANCRKTI